MDTLINFLMFALPGGFVGSIFAWLFGRRKRDNDMLSQLQASINLLSEENRKILSENVQLRRENADLKSNQEEMILKLARLTKEVERLRKVISKQTVNDEKQNPGVDSRNHTAGRASSDRLQRGKAEPEPSDASLGPGRDKDRQRRCIRCQIGSDGTEHPGPSNGSQEHGSDTGDGTGTGSEPDDSPAEPP